MFSGRSPAFTDDVAKALLTLIAESSDSHVYRELRIEARRFIRALFDPLNQTLPDVYEFIREVRLDRDVAEHVRIICSVASMYQDPSGPRT